MPANFDTHNLKSSVDVYGAYRELVKRAESGENVAFEVERCLASISERGCQTMEDALAMSALAQDLYGRAAVFALTDTRYVLATMIEADKHMHCVLEFLEKQAGKTLPQMDARRHVMN